MRRRRTRDQRTDKRCHVCGAARTHGCGVRRHARARIFNKQRPWWRACTCGASVGRVRLPLCDYANGRTRLVRRAIRDYGWATCRGEFRALTLPAKPRAGTYRLSHRLPGQSGAATSRQLGGHHRVNHIFTRPPRTPNLLSARRIAPSPPTAAAEPSLTAPHHSGRAGAGSPLPANRTNGPP